MAESDIGAIWSAAIAQIPVSSSFHRSALNTARPLALVEDLLVVSVPNNYTKREIEDKLAASMSETISDILGRQIRLAFTAEKPAESQPEQGSEQPLQNATDGDSQVLTPPADLGQHETQSSDIVGGIQQTLPEDVVPSTEPASPNVGQPGTGQRDLGQSKSDDGNRLRPNYTFETFVTGSSNRLASATALAVAADPGAKFNPLFFYGDSGLGKTHLMHAIGHAALAKNPNLRVKYVSAEEFTNDFINSIRDERSESFQQSYRKIDLLLIDDIQFIQNKEGTVEEFFHTFNTLYNENKQIVITSDKQPRDLDGVQTRLRSRFEMGMVAQVLPPTTETRIAILQRKATVDGTDAPPEVLEYIASNISSNIRELEGALNRVVAEASIYNKEITLDLAKSILKDVIDKPDATQVTPSMIKEVTAKYFNTTVEKMISSGRSRELAEARQIAMFICRDLTGLSLPSVGKEFGGRDHTTVMHAERKIRKSMADNTAVNQQIQEIINMIKKSSESH